MDIKLGNISLDSINAETIKHFVVDTSAISITLAIALLSYFIVKVILYKIVSTVFHKTKNHLDDLLVDSKIFKLASLMAPAMVFLYAKDIINMPAELNHALTAYMGIITTLIFIRTFTLINDIYSTFEISARRPIKGYLQMAQVLIGFLGFIASLYIAIGKSPLGFISGLGAMTAILILIFKDTILSFIAGMQLMFNDLIHKGDWIEVPQFGADGDVIDIALYNVTVQNFDKTIVYIPTSKLMDGSFKNWRGMTESGGRRIKRSIYIDQSTVRFLHNEDIEKYKKISLLSDYMESKMNEDIDPDGADVNKRKLTNIGTFRAYIVNYLKNHKEIRNDLTFIVRQLAPGPEGLPMEIYVFANTTDWVKYEGIQSDIFDHLIASVEMFDLSIFQNPAGSDFRNLHQVPDKLAD